MGPICTKAKEAQAATEKKLADARAVLKRQGVEVDDSMAKRLVAYLPFLTKEQVLLYQPLLLPLGLAIIGSLLIAIGARGQSKRPKFEVVSTNSPPTPSDSVVIDVEPEPSVPTFRPPEGPKLVTSSPEGAGSIPKILHELLEPATGKRVEIKDCHEGYAARCRIERKRPVPPLQFIDPVKQFCRRAGIRTKAEGDRFYLVGVQLVASLRGQETQ